MTLRDTVQLYIGKITRDNPGTRYCGFAPPEETAGVIDTSPDGSGSSGIAFLADRLVMVLDGIAVQLFYSEIENTEIIPSYESAFEDELIINAGRSVRISDCSLNKRELQRLLNDVCYLSAAMTADQREELSSQLTAEALEYYSADLQPAEPAAPRTEPERSAPAHEAPSGSPEEYTDEDIRKALMKSISVMKRRKK